MVKFTGAGTEFNECFFGTKLTSIRPWFTSICLHRCKLGHL